MVTPSMVGLATMNSFAGSEFGRCSSYPEEEHDLVGVRPCVFLRPRDGLVAATGSIEP